MVVFGGMASLRGSVFGAAALVLLPEALRFVGVPQSIAAPIRQMIYGLLLVVILLKRPQGLIGAPVLR
jgi:branched-chain amino acid transport system permease protein